MAVNRGEYQKAFRHSFRSGFPYHSMTPQLLSRLYDAGTHRRFALFWIFPLAERSPVSRKAKSQYDRIVDELLADELAFGDKLLEVLAAGQ